MITEVAGTKTDAELHHLDQVVIEVVQALERQQGAPADVMRVRQLVEREWARYDDARVRSFVPVLVRRTVIGDVLGGGRPPSPAVPG